MHCFQGEQGKATARGRLWLPPSIPLAWMQMATADRFYRARCSVFFAFCRLRRRTYRAVIGAGGHYHIALQEFAAEAAIVAANKAKQPGEKRPAIYNADALHEKLEDIAWAGDADWAESLAVTSAQPTTVEDIDDDLSRELAFYNQVPRCSGRGGVILA